MADIENVEGMIPFVRIREVDVIFAFPTDRDVYIVNCREFCDDMQEYLDEVE